ncbi:hypothetical protein LSG31_18205 [Fodinisporobacter ferrooxydans]|uniref:Uncharacterized protein n=1 Tax=Fodinisporobacter ferrooxydans TaxID=2901836 RepID=A0ABY4CGZ6_9BACL|nr:hypothetical protein LSG31_18205 [Alicyclobacillaceae bacterium MYW30-H2]
MIMYAVVFLDDQLEGTVIWNEYIGTDYEVVKVYLNEEKFYKVEMWRDGQLLQEFYREHH